MSVAKELTAQVAMRSFNEREFRFNQRLDSECFTVLFIDQNDVKGHENLPERYYN